MNDEQWIQNNPNETTQKQAPPTLTESYKPNGTNNHRKYNPTIFEDIQDVQLLGIVTLCMFPTTPHCASAHPAEQGKGRVEVLS